MNNFCLTIFIEINIKPGILSSKTERLSELCQKSTQRGAEVSVVKSRFSMIGK
jgi:hypothetical protein